MTLRAWCRSMCLVILAIVLACGGKSPGTREAATESRALSLDSPHPRLLLTPDKLQELRASLEDSRKFLWDRFLDDLPHMIGVSRRTIPLGDVRYDGDLAADLAFAWLMTGEDSLLAQAKSQVLRLTDPASWEAPGSLIYLIGSHFLMGISLAYDWLYPALTPEERQQIAACLGREAQTQYESIVGGRIWWRNQYYQNHSHSNYCGLAFAAAALHDEDERAKDWLAVCGTFFDKVFEVLPKDGSSVEGYAYAGYGGEYILKYALLARDLLGKDYTASPWMKNYTSFMIQGLLPYCTSREWALTFGDAPRRGWTSTAQHLFTLASIYHDPAAQWMGRFTVGLYPQGLGSHGWMMLTYYDPVIVPADPASFPTFFEFSEIGQVMMRSSWSDTSAMLVGFKCGPFMTRTYSRDAPFDWGTGHEHTDEGSFQVFAHGQFLTIDPLYTGYKLTSNHSTLLFKERGQMGEQAGFGSAEALRFGHYPEILLARSTPEYDYTVGDVSKAYHPALGVRKLTRHLLFIKPDILAVADEIQLDNKGIVNNYPPEELKTEGGLEHAENGYVIGKQGEAYLDFQGKPGTYSLAAVYLDNKPGEGRYALTVDGREVYSWISRNEGRDDNLIEVSPPVELKTGSRVAFRAAPMAEECRLTRLIVFSPSVPAAPSAQWLLHFDPQAGVQRTKSGITETLGEACLDVYPLLPREVKAEWGIHVVKNADVEPFTFRQTKRLVLSPRLEGGAVTMLTLLHARAQAGPALEDVKASIAGGRIALSWTRQGAPAALDWDLGKQELGFK